MAETLVEPGLSPGRPLLCMASRLYRDQQPLVLFALAMLHESSSAGQSG